MNSLIFVLIELWRRFPFIWGYISIIFNIILTPFVILSGNSPFLILKYFIVSPVLIVLTLWRIAYIPINKETAPKYKILMSKLSKWFGKYLCCIPEQKRADKSQVNTTKCMEIFFWFVAFGNIIIAAIFGFIDGIYLNSICGVILSVTVPIPAKLLTKKNGYYIEDGNKYDGVAPIHWLWIVTFTLWDWTYVWHYSYVGILTASFHLLPNAIRSLLNKDSYKLYLQLRVFCLAIALWIKSTVVLHEDIPWFLNGENFEFIKNISENERWVFEVIGAVTFIMSVIHLIIFIKGIVEQRKIDQEMIRIKMEHATENEELNVDA